MSKSNKKHKKSGKATKAAASLDQTRDWTHYRDKWVDILEKQTGKGLNFWNARVRKEKFDDKRALTTWLTKQGVTGYARQLLVMERFGYPDFLTASAQDLIEAQYADRPNLRPIYEAIIAATRNLGECVIQARKGFVALLTPRRTFARVIATKDRVELGLRLDGTQPNGRLQPSKIHETMKLQIPFTTVNEVDAEALRWLKKAYDQNC